MADPISVYSTGRGYVQSAFAMMASSQRMTCPNDTTFFLGFHMLIGFATELYLKSFLLNKGLTEKQLRRHDFGHDLNALWSEAKSKGFPEPSVAPLIAYLHSGHKKFEYRYMERTTKYTVTRLDIIFDWLSRLDAIVDHTSGARASFGLAPESGWKFPPDRAEWRF